MSYGQIYRCVPSAIFPTVTSRMRRVRVRAPHVPTPEFVSLHSTLYAAMMAAKGFGGRFVIVVHCYTS